jgi:hypothetical protein
MISALRSAGKEFAGGSILDFPSGYGASLKVSASKVNEPDFSEQFREETMEKGDF